MESLLLLLVWLTDSKPEIRNSPKGISQPLVALLLFLAASILHVSARGVQHGDGSKLENQSPKRAVRSASTSMSAVYSIIIHIS